MSQLIIHAGGREVGLEELNEVRPPPPEGRWFPLSHQHVLMRVKETLDDAGFVVARERYALSADNHRFFGVLDMKSEMVPGVSLAVGVRNSTDKKFPIGFCAGSRTFVCDNLAFSAELLVSRKHTRFGAQRFSADIASAMPRLGQFREQESERIDALKRTEISDVLAESIIVRAFDKGIIAAQLIGDVLREWREPSFDDFKPRTLWSLASAFTTVLGRQGRHVRNPNAYVQTTMRLNSLVTPLALEAKGTLVQGSGMEAAAIAG